MARAATISDGPRHSAKGPWVCVTPWSHVLEKNPARAAGAEARRMVACQQIRRLQQDDLAGGATPFDTKQACVAKCVGGAHRVFGGGQNAEARAKRAVELSKRGVKLSMVTMRAFKNSMTPFVKKIWLSVWRFEDVEHVVDLLSEHEVARVYEIVSPRAPRKVTLEGKRSHVCEELKSVKSNGFIKVAIAVGIVAAIITAHNQQRGWGKFTFGRGETKADRHREKLKNVAERLKNANADLNLKLKTGEERQTTDDVIEAIWKHIDDVHGANPLGRWMGRKATLSFGLVHQIVVNLGFGSLLFKYVREERQQYAEYAEIEQIFDNAILRAQTPTTEGKTEDNKTVKTTNTDAETPKGGGGGNKGDGGGNEGDDDDDDDDVEVVGRQSADDCVDDAHVERARHDGRVIDDGGGDDKRESSTSRGDKGDGGGVQVVG